MSHFKIVVLVLLSISVSGCALFSKGDVPMRRYFSPDLPPAPGAVVRGHSNSELRLGRVTAGAFIGERIVFRESDHEVGLYDDRIWTEKPELYLRRALTRVLFEEQGLRSVMRGAGPTLDVELMGFEEVLTPVHLGRVKVSFSLSDERVVSLQQTLQVEKVIPTTSKVAEPSAVAEAMGEALREAVYEISSRVAAGLAAGTSPLPPCRIAGEP